MALIPQKCSSCGAEIGFIKSVRGRSMPVDYKPLKVILTTGEVVSGYVSHFSTCPTAELHRKKPEPVPVERKELPRE